MEKRLHKTPTEIYGVIRTGFEAAVRNISETTKSSELRVVSGNEGSEWNPA